jgi:hypothetical protein
MANTEQVKTAIMTIFSFEQNFDDDLAAEGDKYLTKEKHFDG